MEKPKDLMQHSIQDSCNTKTYHTSALMAKSEIMKNEILIILILDTLYEMQSIPQENVTDNREND